MRKLIFVIILLGSLAISLQKSPAQSRAISILNAESVELIQDTLTSVMQDGPMRMGEIRLRNIGINDSGKKLVFYFNTALSEFPIRKEKVALARKLIQEVLPFAYKDYEISLMSDDKELEELIPIYFGGLVSTLTPEQRERNRIKYEKSANPNYYTPEEPQSKTKKKPKSKASVKAKAVPIVEKDSVQLALQRMAALDIVRKRSTKTQQRIDEQKLELRKEEINKQKWEAQQQRIKDREAIQKHHWPDLGDTPLVIHEDLPYTITGGLQNKHLAVWQSHGWYYEQKLLRWEWQRSRLFQTVEDLYTQSYVLPFLTPMLENAGATVLLPRERDTQVHEVIVDNDSPQSGYSESSGTYLWETSSENSIGFAHPKSIYSNKDNPFTMGTFRQVPVWNPNEEPSKQEKRFASVYHESTASWMPDLPQKGSYAVYVAYKSTPLSTRKAQYTVHHLGGESHFTVNQQMGGGTWIYLGTFLFDKGQNPTGQVTLSNFSNDPQTVVSADAVKFGGGMGNIGRYPQDSLLLAKYESIDFQPQTSQYPRFAEGARYWLQWAGFADSVYTYYNGANDYTDDYTSRGRWVNALSGGSAMNPTNPGLNIPLDLSFALHSDAGSTLNDSIVGSLAIYTRKCEGIDLLPTGEERHTSRDLADIIQTQVVNDIRAQWNPDWTRRGIWNKSYAESRLPQVPSMLLELLSHQNLADMRYGLDPAFRFTVSRAIYKGILRYLSTRYGTPYIVQPLPVQRFAIRLDGSQASLSWQPRTDSLESSAKPKKYRVYMRKGNVDQPFDNGQMTDTPTYSIALESGVFYSFKVAAVNDGGESFPSEILSVYKSPQEKGKILIVNGFTRVSAPDSYASLDTLYGGFTDYSDHGVPYLYDISYTGSQYEFRRKAPYTDDDAPGFGASHADYETRVIPGNTFDYTLLHGTPFANEGYSYTSASALAFSALSAAELKTYFVADLILGKQKKTPVGGLIERGVRFEAFPVALQQQIAAYLQLGGNVLVSGAYVASDLFDAWPRTPLDATFAQEILHYKWRNSQGSVTGEVVQALYPLTAFYHSQDGQKTLFQFNTQLNQDIYCVESPDVLEPANDKAHTILRYRDSNMSAAVAYKNPSYATVVLGFPLETLLDEAQRQKFIKKCLIFFQTDSSTDK